MPARCPALLLINPCPLPAPPLIKAALPAGASPFVVRRCLF